jgi:hypothetical protein
MVVQMSVTVHNPVLLGRKGDRIRSVSIIYQGKNRKTRAFRTACYLDRGAVALEVMAGDGKWCVAAVGSSDDLITEDIPWLIRKLVPWMVFYWWVSRIEKRLAEHVERLGEAGFVIRWCESVRVAFFNDPDRIEGVVNAGEQGDQAVEGQGD